MPRRAPYPQAVMDALAVMDQTPIGHAWAEYARAQRIPIIFDDTLGGSGGTAWLGWRIYFPTSMRTYLEPDRLVHELVHTTQGPYLWGSLENERGAYIVQYRYLAETAADDAAREFYLGVVARLQAGGGDAYDWIRERGPYYAHFAVQHPKLWQAGLWLPQVRYALAVAAARGRRDVEQI